MLVQGAFYKPATPAAPTGTLLSASFTAPDGTLVTDYVPEVPGTAGVFSVISGFGGSMVIQSDRATGPDALSSYGNAFDRGNSNVQITFTARYTDLATGLIGVYGRFLDASHYFIISHDALSNTLALVAVPGGTLDSTTFNASVGPAYAMKAIFDGTTIQFYVDDVLKLQATSSLWLTATQFGIATELNGANVDDLVVVGL